MHKVVREGCCGCQLGGPANWSRKFKIYIPTGSWRVVGGRVKDGGVGVNGAGVRSMGPLPPFPRAKALRPGGTLPHTLPPI